MRSFFTATLVAVALLVVGAGTAAAGNLKSYEGASWYEKYLSVSAPEPLPVHVELGRGTAAFVPGEPAERRREP